MSNETSVDRLQSPDMARRLLAACAAAMVLGSAAGSLADPVTPVATPITPAPISATAAPGTFTLDDRSTIAFDPADTEGAGAASYFADLVRRTCGLQLRLQPGGKAGLGVVRFERRTGSAIDDEAYALDVEDGRATIAGGGAGEFYGGVSLWQLVSPDGVCGRHNVLAGVRIADKPRFSWRGLMIDSARHYQAPSFIEQVIDWMAINKLNTLHWHLTDNQGWRLQIDAFPKLTGVGAWRAPLSIDSGDHTRVGGYYSKVEVREILAYARARHVTIVPEIDIPGHSAAALAAYPALSVVGKPFAVPADWGIHLDSFNLKPATFAFLDGVFGEVADLFPGQFVDIGGDEVVPLQWMVSDEAQSQIHALGLKSASEVQGYITRKVGDVLASRGKRMIGWDEILATKGLRPDTAIMSWRGVQGAIDAARSGRDTVLTPFPTYYLNEEQTTARGEPPSWLTLVTLHDVYAFDPALTGLSASEQAHVLGVEGAVWTEFIDTDARFAHMAFPRAIAVAETAWSPWGAHDWDGFVHRLAPALRRDASLGLDAAQAAFQPELKPQFDRPGSVSVAISTGVGIGQLRYTTDGAIPDARSALYTTPLHLPLPTRLSVALFDGAQRISPVVAKRFDADSQGSFTSADMALCKGPIMIAVEDDGPANGPRAVFPIDPGNPCWTLHDVNLDGVVSLAAMVGEVPAAMPPANYAYGQNPDEQPRHAPRTLNGEFELRLDGCGGRLLASAPLAAPQPGRGLVRLPAGVFPVTGRHDLCLSFTSKRDDVWWGVDALQLDRPQ